MSQDAVQEQYVLYLDRLLEVVYDSLVPKTALWDRWTVLLSDRALEPSAGRAVLTWIVEALEIDVVLTLAKLLEGERSDRNVLRFLNFVESNRARIEWRAGSPPARTLLAQKSELQRCRSAIDAVLGQRDKFYAHSDKDYFLMPQRRHADFPIRMADVVDLIRTIQAILREHDLGLRGSARVSLDAFVYVAADRVFQDVCATQCE